MKYLAFLTSALSLLVFAVPGLGAESTTPAPLTHAASSTPAASSTAASEGVVAASTAVAATPTHLSAPIPVDAASATHTQAPLPVPASVLAASAPPGPVPLPASSTAPAILSSPASSVDASTNAPANVQWYDEAAVERRLAGPVAAGVFIKYNVEHSKQIQDNLYDIYKDDPAFKTDFDAVKRPLRDAIVGPVTLKWVARFCHDYGILASETDFENDIVVSLEQVADLASAHPDWIKILLSDDFTDWIDQQPSARQVRIFKIRRSGAAPQVNALIDLYLRERGAAGEQAGVTIPGVNVTYRYDPKDLQKPKDEAALIQRLLTIRTFRYDDRDSFNFAVRGALTGIPVDNETIAMIDAYSAIDTYQLTAAALVDLSNKGVDQDLVDKLNSIVGTEYDSVDAFRDALATAATGTTDVDGLTRNMDSLIAESRIGNFQIPDSLQADFAAAAVLPAPVAKLFADLSDAEYPNREMFDSAVKWRVNAALNMCPVLRHTKQGRMVDSDFEDLRAIYPTKAALFAKIAALRNRTTPCSPEQRLDATMLVDSAYEFLYVQLDRVAVLQKYNVAPPASVLDQRQSKWGITWCKCARVSHSGMVYGFYPLWTNAGERQFDFGQLTRIGMYGMTANDNGALELPPGMTSMPTALIDAAHTHMTKVDWVIFKNDWRNWSHSSAEAKQHWLNTLSDSIMNLIDQRLLKFDKHGTVIASLGFDPDPRMGDGVTLDFVRFPSQDKALFNNFVIALSKRLHAAKPSRRLNIMASHREMVRGDGVYGYGNLADLIDATNTHDTDAPGQEHHDEAWVDLQILTTVEEPLGNSLVALRSEVENAVYGTMRERLLRDITPVTVYNGVGSDRMRDDIFYMGDNFAGFGFWPVPFANTSGVADAANLNDLLHTYYQHTDGTAARWQTYISYLCPYRLWIRWIAWLSVLVAIGVAFYYVQCSGCGARAERNPLLVLAMIGLMAVPFGILLLLLVSDPLFQDVSIVFLLIYANAGLVATAIVSRYYYLKSCREIP